MALRRAVLIWLALGILLTNGQGSNQAQGVQDLVNLRIAAAFDGYYRENNWLPLRITVSNAGDPLDGRLIVRPETSGRVVSSAYSSPVNLPTGGEREVFLYVQARSFPPRLVVELLDEDGQRVAERSAELTPILGNDMLHVVVAPPTTQTILLTNVHAASYQAHQARWEPAHLPDDPAALLAVDTIFLINLPDESLRGSQRQALLDWVSAGGQLIVTGGTSWQGAASLLGDVLPLNPTGTQTIDSLGAIATWVGDDAPLEARSVLATGELHESARVLIAEGDLPLLIRRSYGGGTIDFLALDPGLEPLRSWNGQQSLWWQMLSSRPPQPAWMRGILDYPEAAASVAVLPGVELLPPASTMLLFISAYIVLIGPINYIVLARINRRGFAWITMPLLILIFSGLAWNVGFNLRGSEVILSRMQVVQSWPDVEKAQVNQVIGVLAPRRAVYSMEAEPGWALRVIPGLTAPGIFATQNTQSTAEITQSEQFSAQDFATDGGIFANFTAQGLIERPALSGRLTLSFNEDGTQSLQGILRNDSDQALNSAVILARGFTYRLTEPLAPRDILTLGPGDLTLANLSAISAPAPIEVTHELPFTSYLGQRRFLGASTDLYSLMDIAGEMFRPDAEVFSEEVIQVANRRSAFLGALMRDAFASTARGHEAYLIGWGESFVENVRLSDTPTRYIDSTLYIAELDVRVEPAPRTQTVTVTADQFSWAALERLNVEGAGVNDVLLANGSALAVRFTPLPGARLRDIEVLEIEVDRSSGYSRLVDVALWDYEADTWRVLTSSMSGIYEVSDPARYIGPDNRVDVRLSLDNQLGTARVRGIGIRQTGRF